MKLNRSLPCLAATVACLLMPIKVVYGQTTITTTVATGSITCDMISADPMADQVTTEIRTFDQVVLEKDVVVGEYGTGIYYHVLSRWGGTEKVEYTIFVPDPVPVGTTLAPISGSFIGEDAGQWSIDYDELGQLNFKLDKRGRLTVTGTSFATPPTHFITVPEGEPVPLWGTCTWNLKGNV